jgi:DNA-binding response OmpR family regulator
VTNPKNNLANPGGPQPENVFRPRILLADDDVEMRTLLTFTLEGEGYEVIECTNGTELLEQLNTVGVPNTSQRLDLVITDLRMPGMSGLELLGRLRHRRGVPPVILITAFGDEQTHIQARQLGAAASVDKPFEMTCFLELVRALIASPSPPDNTPNDTSDSL